MSSPFRCLGIPDSALEFAKQKNFELRGYVISAKPEQLRPARIVRVGIIQNKILLPTTAPLADQRNAIHNRIAEIISAGHQCGVNVMCMQEAWSKN